MLDCSPGDDVAPFRQDIITKGGSNSMRGTKPPARPESLFRAMLIPNSVPDGEVAIESCLQTSGPNCSIIVIKPSLQASGIISPLLNSKASASEVMENQSPQAFLHDARVRCESYF